jgi:aminoglycoside phosphotransferase (APT) family kinase protein
MDEWLQVAVAACDHAGIKVGPIETLVTWDQKYCANAVYRLDAQRYLKVFGPKAERQFHIERAVLRALESNRAIPAPRIIAAGERAQGPSYLVLTAMPGETAEDVWKSAARAEQLTIARELGEITAAIHRLPLEDLAAVEEHYGDRDNYVINPERARRTAEIQAIKTLSSRQRDNLLRFLNGEAREHINGPPKVTHFDLAHNHIYLSRATGTWRVKGIIDWGEAVLGPPEWDVAYLCFWTFSGFWRSEWEPMRVCLGALFANHRPPERFARRCLAALLHTPSMSLLWRYFAARPSDSNDIVRDLTEFFFPPDVFGPAD